jgi:predicted MFS family arabinose efflux permease
LATTTRSVLREPGAAFQAVSGLIGQFSQGAAAIGIVLVVHEHTGSIALGGAVAGVLAVAAGVARPIQGRLMDRHGLATLNAACGVLHPAALIAIVAVSVADGPHALLLVLGALAGLTLAPISTAMRVAWGEAAGDDDRTAAYSMVYLTQELSLLTAPLIFAVLTASTSAAAGLVVIAALSGIGTIAFAASVRSLHLERDTHEQRRRASVLRAPGMLPLLASAAAVGGVIGGIQVGVPTLATAHHKPAAAGVLVAMLSIGGIIGAAAYGMRQWASDPPARLLLLTSAMTVGAAVMIASEGLIAVGLLLLLIGVALNPALTTLSVLVDRLTQAPTAAEAFGWLSTGISAGTGAAAAIAGVLVQHGGSARPAFAVTAVAAAVATLLALAISR